MINTDQNTSNRRPPLVIVVDDEEWSARSLDSVLSPRGYSVIRCRSARQVLDHVQNISPDALFVKADLPDLPGTELCRALRSSGYIGAATPIIIVSKAPFRRAERHDALGSGAWDLITLPIDASELLLRLNVFVSAKLEADNARDRSLLDLASGLYSVRGLVRRIKELSLDAYRHRTPLACVVVAPEDQSAEQGGYSADDRAIGERLSLLMNDATRGSDSVGRLTPTEFAVLAPHTSSSEVLKLAERLKRTLEELQAQKPNEPLVRVRIGCYAVDQFEEIAIEPVEILVRATMALRRAQRDVTAPPICFFGHAYSAS
jgi:diguanylate cyclase (GGDEF)-like protein